MNCPTCGKPTWDQSPKCTTCGQDLGLFHEVTRIKQQLSAASRNSNGVTQRLREIEGKMGLLESNLVAQVAVRPSQTRIENPRRVVAIAEATPTPKTLTPKPLPPAPSPQCGEGEHSQKVPPRNAGRDLGRGFEDGGRGFEGKGRGSQRDSTAEIRFGQKWMLIAGIAAMVLGIGYFLKYSFDQNWIGNEMRIAMAFLTGLGLLGGGEFSRRKDLRTFGLYLIGGGIATLYFSTYAADQIYALISTTTAFGLMIGVTALACSLAVFYNTKWLAVLGLIGGFASPMVLGSSDSNQLALLSYITVLNAGILSIAFFKRWRLLYNLSFLATWATYFVSLLTLRGTGDELIGRNLFFVSLFFVTYTVVPYLRSILSKENAKLSDFAITFPNAAIAFGFSYTWLYNLEVGNWTSAISLSYASLFGVLAYVIHYRNPENRMAIVNLLGKASLFLVLTVPLLVSGNWITLFWFLEAVVLLGIGVALKERLPVLGATALLALSLGKLFYHDFTDLYGLSERLVYLNGYAHLIVERMATLLTAVASTFAFAQLVVKKGAFLGESQKTLRGLFQTLFGLLLFVTLNIETVAFFSEHDPASRDASLSVLWTLFSVGLMSLGFLHNRKPLRSLSIALFGITAGKVLFFDLAHVETPYRVLSLIVLGAMLIGASFLYHKFAGRILENREVVS